MSERPTIVLRVALLIGYVLFILINVAAGQGWLGPNNAQLSKRNPTPITPAGWTFSIWGLVFLLQGAGVVYASLDYGYAYETKTLLVEAVGYSWLAGWTFEALWQILFQLQSRLGTWLCMLTLLAAFASLSTGEHHVERIGGEGWEWVLYSLPTSINMAWLSVASCIGILMVTIQEGLPGSNLGAVLLAAAVTGLGLFMMVTRANTAYGLVLVWSFAGVFAKQDRWPVGMASALCALLCLLSIISTIYRLRAESLGSKSYHEYSEL